MKDLPSYNRHSIRLKGYDYSNAGCYFITVCTQDKISLFGDIQEGEMIENEVGRMVYYWIEKIGTKKSIMFRMDKPKNNQSNCNLVKDYTFDKILS